MRKFILVGLLSLLLIFSFTGCGGSSGGSTAGSSDAIKIEDIDWSAKTSLVNSQTVYGISYTNNSDYSIVEMEIRYDLKDDVGIDKTKEVFSEYIDNGDFTDEDIKEFYLWAPDYRYTESGETTSSTGIYINGSFWMVSEQEQLDIMEPSYILIKYVDSKNLYEETYDFKNQAYSENADPIVKYSWASNDLTKQVPEPDKEIVIESMVTDDFYSADVFNVSKDDYNDYVQKCRDKGFTKNETFTDGVFSADKNAKFSITVYYDENTSQMSIQIDKN